MKLRKLMMAAALGGGMILSTAVFADEAPPNRGVGEYAADVLLTTRIKAAFIGEKDLSVMDISVQTTNGVVVLTGTVGSSAQAELAGRVAAGIDGVKQVDNRLKVAPVKAIE